MAKYSDGIGLIIISICQLIMDSLIADIRPALS